MRPEHDCCEGIRSSTAPIVHLLRRGAVAVTALGFYEENDVGPSLHFEPLLGRENITVHESVCGHEIMMTFHALSPSTRLFVELVRQFFQAAAVLVS